MNGTINMAKKNHGSNKNSKLHALILCSTLILSSAFAPEYYTVVLFFILAAYLFAYGIRIDKEMIRMFLPFVLIVPFGLIYSFQNDLYDAMRDLWYALKVIICFFTGYFISRKISNLDGFINLFVRTSFFLAILYLIEIFILHNPLDFNTVSKRGDFPLILSMALPLLLFSKKNYKYRGFIGVKYLMIFTLMAAFIFSQSRTSIGCLFILILACLGLFDNVKRTVASIILIFLIAFVSYTKLLPEYDPGNVTLLGKISNSISEISFTDGVNKFEMIHNWRGFEAYQAYIGFLDASAFEKIFGRGLGATVDIGAEVQMSENMSYQFLPNLHNGYMHILTKFGLIGLLLYIIFLAKVAFSRIGTNFDGINYAWMNRGIGFVFIYTSLVITGLFNKEVLDPLLIYLGFMYGFSASINRRKNTEKIVISHESRSVFSEKNI